MSKQHFPRSESVDFREKKDEEKAEEWRKELEKRREVQRHRERLMRLKQQSEVQEVLNMQIHSKRQSHLSEQQADHLFASSQAQHAQYLSDLEQAKARRDRMTARKHKEELLVQIQEQQRRRKWEGGMSEVELGINREEIQAANLGLPALWWPSSSHKTRFPGSSFTPSPTKHSPSSMFFSPY